MILFDKSIIIFVLTFFLPICTNCDLNLLAQCSVQLMNVSNLLKVTAYVTMSSEVTYDFRIELLHSMHRSYKPIILLNAFSIELFNPNQKILPYAYVVVARGVSDLVDHLDAINVTHASWQPEVNFIVILETVVIDLSENVLKPVFHQFWINNIFRSVLLIPTLAIGNNTVEAFAWYPFQGKCGVYHTPKKVTTCRRLDNNDHGQWNVVNDTIFDNRIPDMFDDCTVKIAGFHWPPLTLLSNDTPRTMLYGMDVEVIKLMSRIGNVKLQFKEIENDERWGVKFNNGTWNGGLGYLSRHKADIMVGGGILTPERMQMFDSAPPRQVIRLQLYTPLPRKLPYWQNMLNVFSGNFWFTLFLVFIVTSTLLWLSGVHLPSERHTFSDWGYCLIVSWAILCSVPFSGRQPTSVSSKMIFLSWVIYMLHISAVYTSMQLTYLYRPKYERPMRTINEVKHSKYKVCCVPTFIPIAHSMSRDNFDLTEFSPCINIIESANRLLKKNDIIILDPEDHFEGYISGFKKKVYKVDEVVIIFNIGLFMQKGNPYKRILTKAQITAYETGLHTKWRQEAIPSLMHQSKKETQIKIKKLSFDELQGAFIILLCGFITSLGIFLLEFFFYKYM